MRKVFGTAAKLAIGAALLACSRSQPPAEYASSAMEPSSPLMQAPLQAPLDPTRPPPSAAYDPLTPHPQADSAYAPPPGVAQENGQRLIWRASPRWAAIKKGSDNPARKPNRNAGFEAAKAKAAEVGIENLTDEDIDGLSPDQLKELRGY